MRLASRIAISITAASALASGAIVWKAVDAYAPAGRTLAAPADARVLGDKVAAAPARLERDHDPVAVRRLARATRDTGVAIDPAGKLIEVSLERQELVAWQDGVEVMRFKVSTGRRGYQTPAGRFRVHTKYLKRWSRKWKVWMPYSLFWHPKHGYAFHELPYARNPARRIGASRLGRADSHGCIRVGLGDAKRLYDWAPVGTEVWIH